MQAAVATAFAGTSLRVGDLAWLSRSRTHRELALDIRVWEDDTGALTGWTYFRSNGGFNVFAVPGREDAGLLDVMLDVIEEAAASSLAAGDPPLSLYTYGIDISRSAWDRSLAAALEQRGFEASPPIGGLLRRTLDSLPEPADIDGYTLASVRSPADVSGRVETHRAAFAPSALTVEAYTRLRRRWPYRAELDRIAVTSDGEVAAFCTAWIDEQNAAGLLEPVGTHPAHRRRGLASAVCVDALRALRDAGARIADVGYATDAAQATYRGIGFEPCEADIEYRRPAPLTPGE
jgi:predicted N-acetyltransferase YhbS